MFEIRCIVHDKVLAAALRALDGFTIEAPVIKAVVNDFALGSQPNRPPATDAFKEYTARHKLTKLTWSEIQKINTSLGFSSKSTSTLIQRYTDAHILKHMKHGKYVVLSHSQRKG